MTTISTKCVFQGVEYLFNLSVNANQLVIEIEDSATCDQWRNTFDSTCKFENLKIKWKQSRRPKCVMYIVCEVLVVHKYHYSTLVVRLKHQVDGKALVSTPYRIYVPWSISTKNRKNYCVPHISTCAKFGNDDSTPFPPPPQRRVKMPTQIRIFLPLLLFLLTCRALTPRPNSA